MAEKLKGKLSVRKTKKGTYHAIIYYEKKGKPKSIPILRHTFNREIINSEVEFEMDKGRVTRIWDRDGKTLWSLMPNFGQEQPTISRTPSTQSIDSRRLSNLSDHQEEISLKVLKTSEEFVKSIGYKDEDFNPSIRFNKFVFWNFKQNKFDYAKTIKSNKGNVDIECHFLPPEVKKRIRTLQNYIKIEHTMYIFVEWTAQTQWRMVIGLGSPHVHETAMTWHHTWSVPYIPGSALKGVARSYYLSTLWEKFAIDNPDESWEKTIPCLEAWLMNEPHPRENKVGHNPDKCPVFKWAEDSLKDDKETFQSIFGTQKQKGMVIFMDAYPIERYCLKLDVMNVHYPDYYGGKKDYAVDWESPNPVFFLTVVDTQFKGILLVDKKHLSRLASPLSANELLEKARNILIESLQNFGIGAKTSVGYGLLENPT